MPELPEVETIVRALREGRDAGPSLPGRTLTGGQALWERSIAHPSAAEFAARLPGQTVLGVERRAKFIVIRLTKDVLLIHLRMSGDLRLESAIDVENRPLPSDPHDRVIFYFKEGLRLAFNDTRKFGRVWLTPDPGAILDGLGPEPLDDSFQAADLFRRLKGSRRQLKPLLLDQAFLAGIGNIYADEALHLAGLHPCRAAGELSFEQAQQLWAAIRQALEEGIRNNGASIDWVYRGGSFQDHFRVYQRTGKPCLTCGGPIERIQIGQRSTHFCPVCQSM